MKLQVSNIPEEGLEIDFSQKDGWVREKITRAMGELHRDADEVQGHFSIHKTMENLSVKAAIHLPIHATCNRCLKEYDCEIDVVAARLLTPLFSSDRQRENEKNIEVEVTKDDLEFSYYEGDEIDVGDIIAEQIVLDQPMIYLCRPDCKGLCPHCGVNKNENTCSCSKPSLEKSPFGVLKDLIKE